MSLFKRSSLYRQLAFLSLFALLMLTLGPVISQVKASLLTNNSLPISHNQPATHHLPQDQSPDKTQKSHHLMGFCGYCDLVHHTPLLTIDAPLILQTSTYQLTIISLYLIDYLSPSYTHALSRAPPSALHLFITC